MNKFVKILSISFALVLLVPEVGYAAEDRQIASSRSAQRQAFIGTSYRETILSVGYNSIGTRYCRGGESPKCFDCSGLTQYAYAQLGVTMPRKAGSQLKQMTRITKDEAQPGDLVFFSTKNGYIYHVGIYIGNGQMLHAPRPGRKVRIDTIFRRPIYAKFA